MSTVLPLVIVNWVFHMMVTHVQVRNIFFLDLLQGRNGGRIPCSDNFSNPNQCSRIEFHKNSFKNSHAGDNPSVNLEDGKTGERQLFDVYFNKYFFKSDRSISLLWSHDIDFRQDFWPNV